MDSNSRKLQSIDALVGAKHQIAHKLKIADKKIQKLETILMKKSAKKGRLVPLPAAETTFTIGGFTVSDLKMPVRSSKVTPIDKSVPYSDPALRGSILEGINHRHIQRTVCKREVERLLEEKEQYQKNREEQKNKSNKNKVAGKKAKVPESMLPNRYLRGELPCTIEHGGKGHYLSWACPLESLDYEYYLPIFFDGKCVCD